MLGVFSAKPDPSQPACYSPQRWWRFSLALSFAWMPFCFGSEALRCAARYFACAWYSCRHLTVSGPAFIASMAATAARQLVSAVKYGMPCISVCRRML
jgi:hypothetical protein